MPFEVAQAFAQLKIPERRPASFSSGPPETVSHAFFRLLLPRVMLCVLRFNVVSCMHVVSRSFRMSTLNSTNMSVTRPSTKVRHAPGGHSSINLSFGEDDKPVTKAGFKPSFDPSPELVSAQTQNGESKSAKPAPTPTATGVVDSQPPASTTAAATTTTTDTMGAGVSVGLVFAASSSVNEALKSRTIEVLHSRGVTDISVLKVHDVLQLPFGAKHLIAKSKVQAVIVVAALTEEVWASKEVASAVVSGIVQLSLEQSVPVVPGFVYGVTEKEASTKVADGPSTWVSSAISLFKFDIETASPSAAAATEPVKEAEASLPSPPQKSQHTTATDKHPETAKPAPRTVDNTPIRSSRGRGAGPSSIVFG